MTPRDPDDVAAYDRELAEVTIGGPRPLAGPVGIHDYDPDWPRLYEREKERIRAALGHRVIRIEHVGSTSVPGLPAKPLIDIALEVLDGQGPEAARNRKRVENLRGGSAAKRDRLLRPRARLARVGGYAVSLDAAHGLDNTGGYRRVPRYEDDTCWLRSDTVAPW